MPKKEGMVMKRAYVSGNRFMLWMGLILHLTYYALVITAWAYYGDYSGYGLGRSGGLWIYAVIVAIPVILNYLAEGILAVRQRRSVFNIIKLMLVVALVPLWIFCGQVGGIAEFIIWNTVFMAVFVIEIISLFKCHVPKNGAAVSREVSQNYMSDYREEKREA